MDLGPEFFGHEPQADIVLTAKGFHIAYVNVQNLYGSPTAAMPWTSSMTT